MSSEPKWMGKDYQGYKTFEKDLAVAQVTEVELAEMLAERTGMNILSYNDDFKYDVIFEMKNKKKLFIEIKEDFTCKRTGNVGLEYSCRGKDSGITTTHAHMYFYKLHTPTGIIRALCKVEDLKRIIMEVKYFRTVNGGDPDSNSLNYLFKLNEFLKICKIV